MITRDEIIALTIRLEGGYSDNPADPGGRTNMGVTQRYLDHARAAAPHGVMLPLDVKDLTVIQVTGMYQRDQWVRVLGDALPPTLAALAFDGAVNEGPGTAVMLLQQALSVHVDQFVGPATLAAISTVPHVELVTEYAARRATHYAKLNRPEFVLGWMRRLFTVYTTALLAEETHG
jgi:lysozyme family protein